MENIVEYVLGLRDEMSPKIQGATGYVKSMEGALHGVKEMAISAGEALGLAFIGYKAVEYVHESAEKFHALEQVTAKVEANLEATGEKAGIALDDIQKYAAGLASHIHESQASVTDMASQLLTFPSITKDVFEKSMGLVADIAKQTGHGLSETGIMYGKALNDPIEGLQKMQRYGVVFTEQEKEKITKLQESGKLIEAQKTMMDAIASSGYAGVATKMFEADPLARYNKAMEQVQLSVGSVAMEIIADLAPALVMMAHGLQTIIDGAKEVIEWIKKHKEGLKELGIVLGVTSLATGVLIAYQNWWTVSLFATEVALYAQAIALSVVTAATWLFSAALWSTGIPEIIIAVSALTYGVIELAKHFGGFGNAVKAVWDILKAFGIGVVGVFKGVGESIIGALTFNPKLIAQGLTDTINAAKDAGSEISKVWNNADAKAAAAAKSIMPKEEDKTKTKTPMGQQPIVAPKTKAEGQKNINIHIAINGGLVHEMKITTTNINQSYGKIKDQVAAALTGAINDSQIIGEY